MVHILGGCLLTRDTHEEIDEDEPLVDVSYISDILVNMITGDDQQIGISISSNTKLTEGEFTPWSFELYALGLDIILPKMQGENFKVSISTPPPPKKVLRIDSPTSHTLFKSFAEDV